MVTQLSNGPRRVLNVGSHFGHRPLLDIAGTQTLLLVDQIRSIETDYVSGDPADFLSRDAMAEVEFTISHHLGLAAAWGRSTTKCITSPLSIRFDAALLERLRRRAAMLDSTPSGLAQRLVDEGLRRQEHPGTVFRDGPSGRRAALAAGPDLWEIVSAVRSSGATDEKRAIAVTADVMALSPGQIQLALTYYGAFPAEIEAVKRIHVLILRGGVWRRPNPKSQIPRPTKDCRCVRATGFGEWPGSGASVGRAAHPHCASYSHKNGLGTAVRGAVRLDRPGHHPPGPHSDPEPPRSPRSPNTRPQRCE